MHELAAAVAVQLAASLPSAALLVDAGLGEGVAALAHLEGHAQLAVAAADHALGLINLLQRGAAGHLVRQCSSLGGNCSLVGAALIGRQAGNSCILLVLPDVAPQALSVIGRAENLLPRRSVQPRLVARQQVARGLLYQLPAAAFAAPVALLQGVAWVALCGARALVLLRNPPRLVHVGEGHFERFKVFYCFETYCPLTKKGHSIFSKN